MNIFGYLRVSGKGQIDGDGPERQREAILRFCRACNLGQPEFFYDEAVSGKVDALERVEFVRLLEAIADRRKTQGEEAAACIVVERQDRLARDVIVQELLLSECAKLKIQVFSADQGDAADIASDGIDPTRKMIRQILGVLAEWERTVTVMKLRAARDRKRAATGRCEGPQPYGYTEEERSIQSILVTWHHAGRSYGNIAKEANAMGLKSRKGGPWTRGSVYQAVTRRGVKQPEG
jgi:DNA invertase Pin-like site-specific DNA recombinase